MEWLGPALVNMGGTGVVILIAVLVIRHLNGRNEILQTEKDGLQEKRIEEMKANLAATITNTAAITANTTVIAGNNQRIDVLVQSMQRVENLLQQLVMKG